MPLSPFISVPLTLSIGGAVGVGGWVALYHYYPAVPVVIFDLLTLYPWLTGVWLLLAVVGLDAALVAARDALSYGNVGQKARAHFHLSGGQQ